VLLAALLGAAGSSRAAAPVAPAATPPCEASVSLDPVRAVPGQQVSYRLRLLVRSDVVDVAWEEPPEFPGLRAERLGVHPLPGPIVRDGASYQLREDRRALFAERPGRIALPHARLVCRTAGDLNASVTTPEAVLEVIPLPEGALPPGLVGPLALRARVTPSSVALGQSVRLGVTLEGEGNLWDAREPELPRETLGGAEVFHRQAELVLDRGARLVVRRHFAIDVVPRREGVLQLPELAWSYFDPTTGRSAVAVAPAVDVPVGPPGPSSAAGDQAGPARAARSAAPAAPTPSPPGSFAGRLSAGLLLLGTIAAALWRTRRRRAAAAGAVAEALARADAASAAGDRDGELAGLARALRAAIAAELGGPTEGDAQASLASGASPRARSAAELLARLERARFDPDADTPDRAAVLRVLRG
jgi:hypothetical protein